MNKEHWGIIALAVGALLLFAGDKIANVGDSVDRVIASKWTAMGLIVFGGLFFASTTKLAKAL